MKLQTVVTQESPSGWVITESKSVRLDPTAFDPEAEEGLVKEYRISEIGRYLLNPAPIEIRKQVVGCEVHPAPTGLSRMAQHLPWWSQTQRRKPEVLLTGFKLKLPALRDPDVDGHYCSLGRFSQSNSTRYG